MFKNISQLLFTALTLFVVNLETAEGVQGKIENGRYFFPKNAFSIKMPNGVSKDNIEEILEPPAVLFYGDYGVIVRVEVLFVNSPENAFTSNQEILEFFKDFYDYAIVEKINRLFPSTRILREVIDEANQVYFALLEIPNGSNLTNIEDMKRPDSIRGYHISFAGNQLVVLSMQNHILQETMGHDELKAALLDQLTKARASYINLKQGSAP